jgi:hypothetical protein
LSSLERSGLIAKDSAAGRSNPRQYRASSAEVERFLRAQRDGRGDQQAPRIPGMALLRLQKTANLRDLHVCFPMSR